MQYSEARNDLSRTVTEMGEIPMRYYCAEVRLASIPWAGLEAATSFWRVVAVVRLEGKLTLGRKVSLTRMPGYYYITLHPGNWTEVLGIEFRCRWRGREDFRAVGAERFGVWTLCGLVYSSMNVYKRWLCTELEDKSVRLFILRTLRRIAKVPIHRSVSFQSMSS